MSEADAVFHDKWGNWGPVGLTLSYRAWVYILALSLLRLEREMFLTSSRIWTLGSWLEMLFEKVTEPLGGGAWKPISRGGFWDFIAWPHCLLPSLLPVCRWNVISLLPDYWNGLLLPLHTWPAMIDCPGPAAWNYNLHKFCLPYVVCVRAFYHSNGRITYTGMCLASQSEPSCLEGVFRNTESNFLDGTTFIRANTWDMEILCFFIFFKLTISHSY